MFAVVVPHMKYLRESIITEGIGVSSLDDSALCSSKAAINVVSIMCIPHVFCTMCLYLHYTHLGTSRSCQSWDGKETERF